MKVDFHVYNEDLSGLESWLLRGQSYHAVDAPRGNGVRVITCWQARDDGWHRARRIYLHGDTNLEIERRAMEVILHWRARIQEDNNMESVAP